MGFTPAEVKAVARQQGYEELPVGDNERNHLLRFRHPSKRGCGGTTSETGPVKICVYFTTGKVATSLEHPRAGKGQLQRTVKDKHMLTMVFNYPRVHSNTGYHKKEETKKRHKENGINLKQLTNLARDKYKCALVPGPPQDRTKLVVFQHPTGFRIRVWFHTGTMGVFKKDDKEVCVKNLTLNSIEKYLETPSLAQAENKPTDSSGEPGSSYSTYRPPFRDVQQQSSSTSIPSAESKLDNIATKCQLFIAEKRSLRSVEKDLLIHLANLNGFKLSKDDQLLTQFKSQSGGQVLNVWLNKGTVLVQGKNGLNRSTKNCSFNDFLMFLQKYGSKPESGLTENLEKEETPLAKSLRLAMENARDICSNSR